MGFCRLVTLSYSSFTSCRSPAVCLLRDSLQSQLSNRLYSSSSSMVKKIVVFGATGNQGGSVARDVAPDGDYKVFGVTRDPTSEKAKAMQAKGIEPVKADMADVASLESALEGAYGVFLVTNFLLHRDVPRDKKETANVVDAAKKKGVQHFVYSGLENIKEEMGVECVHYDVKAASEEYIKKSGVPYTFIHYSAYMENLLSILAPRKTPDGNFMLAIPTEDEPFDMVAATEAGEVTHQVFNNPKEFIGKTVGISTDKRTVAGYCEILDKVFAPNKFSPGKMTTADLKGKFPGSDSMAAMYDFWKTQKPKRDIELTKRLHPNIPDFEKWVTINKDKLLKIWNDPPKRGPGGPPGAGRGGPPK